MSTEWTTDKPTTPGWYWCKSGINTSDAEIYWVNCHAEKEGMWIWSSFEETPYPVCGMVSFCLWWGPIEEPGA